LARADEVSLRQGECPADALHEGQAAPLFSLPDADMETVDLGQFRGKKHVVLYFYPKDGTPNCTLEATDFSDHEDEFSRHNCVVIGVSPDDCLSHAGFRDQNGVSIRLLADTDSEVSRKYGVVHEKEANGCRKSCITRSTFIIDKKGTVRHVFYGVNPRGHVAQMLSIVRTLR
jgi:peroxiredoxin Q/BCP